MFKYVGTFMDSDKNNTIMARFKCKNCDQNMALVHSFSTTPKACPNCGASKEYSNQFGLEVIR